MARSVSASRCSPARRSTTRWRCRARSRQRYPGCQVVWGGWHPSLFADECLDEPAIDAAVVGQGEDTFARSSSGCASASRCADAAARSRHAMAAIGRWPAAPASRSQRAARRTTTRSFPSSATSRSRASGSSTTSRRRAAGSAARSAPIPRCIARGWTGLAPERIADEASALQRRYGMRGARVSGRDVLHACARASTRWPTQFLQRAARRRRGRRRCAPIRRAAWARRCSPRRCARACAA